MLRIPHGLSLVLGEFGYRITVYAVGKIRNQPASTPRALTGLARREKEQLFLSDGVLPR
jgi:hypothetical protein